MEKLLEPQSFNAGEHIFDIAFHPTSNVLACTLVNGETKLVSYSIEKTEELLTMTHHKKSARTCAFAPGGNHLATGSEDKSIAIIDQNGDVVYKIKRAHDDPVYSLHFLSDDLLVSGDDDGAVKIWSLKDGQCVWEAAEQEGTITGMTCNQEKNFLLTSCTDGTLGVYDLRKSNSNQNKLYAMSDSMDEDLLAITLVKNEKKVLCSSQEGVIFVFNWDFFGDCKDRILGHPNSIDAMLKIDENTVITGSEDGFIRAVSVSPNKIIDYLGNHSDSDDIEPVTRLGLSHDMRFVASISLDNWIKFHNISNFVEGRKSVQGQEDEEEAENEEGDSDMEEDDSDDEQGGKKGKKMPRKTNIEMRKKEIAKQKKKDFFSDL